MEDLKEKYINPLTNFGFKKIFGSEAGKALLLDFLNALLNDSGIVVKNLVHTPIPDSSTPEIGADDIIRVICTDKNDKKLYAELLVPSQNFFADRAIFHAMNTINSQAKSHEWHYEIDPVISISLLNFVHDSSTAHHDDYIQISQLTDTDTNKVFFDKLTFIGIELPKFKKTADELATRLDKWLYLLNDIHKLSHLPVKFMDDDIFQLLFEMAEVKKLEFHKAIEYKDSLAHHHNWHDDSETSREIRLEKELAEGIALCRDQGVEINSKAVAKTALKMGLDMDTVARITGLSIEELEELKKTVKK